MTTKQLTVNVTEEDIEAGMRCSDYHCPIAIRIHKMGFDEASVRYRGVLFNPISEGSDDGTGKEVVGVWVDLPKEARDFVRNFDFFGVSDVEPFMFTMNVPESLFKTEDIA